MTGDQALAATEQGEYNQLHLTATDGVKGVFIRIAADTGQELGSPKSNDMLRQLAADQSLPVAEIEVQPRLISEGTPTIKISETEGVSRLE